MACAAATLQQPLPLGGAASGSSAASGAASASGAAATSTSLGWKCSCMASGKTEGPADSGVSGAWNSRVVGPEGRSSTATCRGRGRAARSPGWAAWLRRIVGGLAQHSPCAPPVEQGRGAPQPPACSARHACRGVGRPPVQPWPRKAPGQAVPALGARWAQHPPAPPGSASSSAAAPPAPHPPYPQTRSPAQTGSRTARRRRRCSSQRRQRLMVGCSRGCLQTQSCCCRRRRHPGQTPTQRRSTLQEEGWPRRRLFGLWVLRCCGCPRLKPRPWWSR